jgi:hypothetical protein
MMSNMQDQLLQLMQLIQYRHVSLFSTVNTNEFIGKEFCLSPNSLGGYEAMGFDVTQLTQDEEQISFTLKTNMPMPIHVSVWGLFPVGKMVIIFYRQVLIYKQ